MKLLRRDVIVRIERFLLLRLRGFFSFFVALIDDVGCASARKQNGCGEEELNFLSGFQVEGHALAPYDSASSSHILRARPSASSPILVPIFMERSRNRVAC